MDYRLWTKRGFTPLEKNIKKRKSSLILKDRPSYFYLRKGLTGFTLIEVLISGAIISLIAMAVCSVFASGINVWRKGNQSRRDQRNIRLFSEKLTQELRNTFKFSNIPFEGTEDSITFAALIENNSNEENPHDEVGRISYFLNDQNVFCRREETYAESFQPEEAGICDQLIPGVSGINFSYCYLDNATGDYKWKEDWVKEEQDTIPQAIKIELVFKKKSGMQSYSSSGSDLTGTEIEQPEFNKTIFIPGGTGEQKKELK